jgi:hypothetical protein
MAGSLLLRSSWVDISFKKRINQKINKKEAETRPYLFHLIFSARCIDLCASAAYL